MGTLKACLAVVNDFTAEDFAQLEAKAKEYAGGKTLTNTHFIKAAQDTIATLKSDMEKIQSGMEPEEKPAAKPKPPVENKDLKANTPVSPADTRAELTRRTDRLVNHKNYYFDMRDESNVRDAIEAGDFDAARAMLQEHEDRARQGTRYRTTTQQKGNGSFDPISHAELEKIVDQVNNALGGDADVTILDDVRDILPNEKFNRAGALIGGRVYLFRKGIESGDAGLVTVFHELFHKGLRNLLPGDEYNKMMRKLYNQSAQIKELTDAWMNSEVGQDAKLAIDKAFGEGTPKAREEFLVRAVDEVLAEMAEKRKLPGLVRQLGNWLASVADRLGFKGLGDYIRNLGMNPLEVFVNDALRASVEGRPAVFSTRYSTPKGAFDIDAKPGANVVRMAKLLGPKLYGSPEDLQKVSVKEIFQNSFDAIKTLIDRGDMQRGSVKIDTDEFRRTITVTDNGSGMSPNVLANQFLQIAGTFKETERASGGLGIAKMLFLFANESLDVITARDGQVAQLSTSGDELMAALDGTGKTPKVSVAPLEGVYSQMFPDGHGTYIKIKVPQSYTDPATNEQKDIPFSNYASYNVLDYSPLFSNIDVTLNGDTMDIGANFPAQDYTQFANVNFEWGTARIYVTKKPSRQYSKNTHILSNGLWQFSTSLKSNPLDMWGDSIQRQFYVDIAPKVRAEDAGYPFDLNRQQFSKAANDDLGKVFNYISVLYRADDLQNEVKSFGSIQYMDRKDGKVAITAAKDLTPETPTGGVIAAIKEGDKVEVHEGVLKVNGREVPELTREDLKNNNVDIDSLKIDQSEIDPDRVILHDNLEVNVPSNELVEAKAEFDRLQAEYKKAEVEVDRLQVERDAARDATNKATTNDGDYEAFEKLDRRLKALKNKRWDLESAMYEQSDKVRELEKNGNRLPITEAALLEFGPRFNEYVFGIGNTFRQLRDLVADVMDYPDLRQEGMGISFDKEYRGVSIKLPFAGMFINPAVPEFTDPARAAFGMFGTMVHEFAHHKVRSHDANFPAEMQRILINLDAQDKVDIAKIKRSLVEHVKKYEDVLQWLNERNTDDNSKPRGRRFKDGSEQSRFGDVAGDVAGARQAAGGGRGVPDRAGQGSGAGQAGADRTAGRPGGSDGQALDPSTTRFRTAQATVRDMAESFTTSALGKARRAVLSSSFLRDIGERFKSLAGVTDFVQKTFAMSARASDYQGQAMMVNRALNALSDADRKAVTSLMADATSNGVHVEETKDRKNDHMKTAEQKATVADIQGRFNKLSDAQKNAYRTARDQLDAMWKKRGELMAGKAEAIYRPLIDEAVRAGDEKKADQFRRELRAFLTDTNARLAKIKGDYFPLLRFGDWVVTRKSKEYNDLSDQVDAAHEALNRLYDKYEKHTPEQRKAIAELNKKRKARGEEVIGEFTEEEAAEIKAARDAYNKLSDKLEAMKASESDYYMAQFESEGEAKLHARDVGGEYELKREHHRELNPISRTMLSRLEESLADSMRSRGSVTALRDAKRAMFEVYLYSLPERSAMMRQLKRKNVAGFSHDMQRSIMSSMLRDSFFLSRMEFSDDITDSLNRMYDNAKQTKDVKHQEVHSELARRTAAGMRYVDTPLQDMAAATTYMYRLGVSPGYLIANMMQPFTVSMPMLWARHGAKSTAGFAKAWGQALKMVQSQMGEALKTGDLDFTKAGLAADEVEMLNNMLRQRLLNVTLVSDIATTADGKKVSKLSAALAKPSHVVEVVNRLSTALAAYRLEKKLGVEAATKYSAKVLSDTHFDYSAENAPYWMKPGVVPMSKVLFQFKKYQLGMISLFAKTVAGITDKKTRAEASNQLAGLLFTHMAIGGLLGLPAASLIASIATLLGDDKDDPWDARVALRNWAYDNFGKETGDVLTKGLFTLAGMDFSQKAGLGDILNPMPTLRTDKSGRDLALEAVGTLAGPFIGGVVLPWAEAASYMAKGEFWKGAELMVPKWLSDPFKAVRYTEQGITTKQGTVALSGDEISAWDAALQGMGIPSNVINSSFEGRAAVQDLTKRLGSSAGLVKQQWAQAKRDGDTERADEIWQKVRDEINPVRKSNGLQPITMGDLLRYRASQGKTESQYENWSGAKNAKLGEVARFSQ